MNRRNFIRTSGLSLAAFLTREMSVGSLSPGRTRVMALPTGVTAIVNGRLMKLEGKDKRLWKADNVIVSLKEKEGSLNVAIQAPSASLSAVSLHWELPLNTTRYVLNDDWERTYGDVSWHNVKPGEILPWYFMEFNERSTSGFGVKTGTKSFCYWQSDPRGLLLTLDVRSGGDGVKLGERTLNAAEIVTTKNTLGETPFETTRRFVTMMCDHPRMPKKPVYGINDWYYTYGQNSAKLILEHTALMAPMSDGLSNRPFSVIDAGWFRVSPSSPDDTAWGEDLGIANGKFGDMSKVSERIRSLGMRPGLWTRPLCGSRTDSESTILPRIKGREKDKPVLDPSIPENLE
ncbi:MAG: hypothetical protein WB699_14480, partial [Bacteroidota bacterium]